MKINLFESELHNHGKIFAIELGSNDIILTCEVDCIQSVARAIVKRVGDKYGNFVYKSSTRTANRLGCTKVVVLKQG